MIVMLLMAMSMVSLGGVMQCAESPSSAGPVASALTVEEEAFKKFLAAAQDLDPEELATHIAEHVRLMFTQVSMLETFSPEQVDEIFTSLLHVMICTMGCSAHVASKMVEQASPLDLAKKRMFIHKLLEVQELSRIGQLGMICSSKLISESADSGWDIKPLACAKKRIEDSRAAIKCLRELPVQFHAQYPHLNRAAWEEFIVQMERRLNDYERHVQEVELSGVSGIMGASKEKFDVDQLVGCNAIGINILASHLAAATRGGNLERFGLFLNNGTADRVNASVELCRESVGTELPKNYVAVPMELVPSLNGRSLRPLAKLLCEGSQKKSSKSDDDKGKGSGERQDKDAQQSPQVTVPTPVVIAQASRQKARAHAAQ